MGKAFNGFQRRQQGAALQGARGREQVTRASLNTAAYPDPQPWAHITKMYKQASHETIVYRTPIAHFAVFTCRRAHKS